MQTRDIFCTKCQAITPHIGTVDSNGDLVFTCQAVMIENVDGNEVGHHFIKLSSQLSVDEVNEALTKHEEVNTGQVSVEEQEAKLEALMQAPAQPEEEETPKE